MKNGLQKTRRLGASGLLCNNRALQLAAQAVKFLSIVLLSILAISSCREKNQLPSEKQIASFAIKGIPGSALIDHEHGVITMTVSFGTLLRNLNIFIYANPLN